MVGETICVSMAGGPEHEKTMREDGVKAMGGDGCVYSRWTHMRHITSKIEGIMIQKRGVVIPFCSFFLMKGKRVNT